MIVLFQLANLGTLTRESIRASGTKVSCTQNGIMNCVYLSLSLSAFSSITDYQRIQTNSFHQHHMKKYIYPNTHTHTYNNYQCVHYINYHRHFIISCYFTFLFLIRSSLETSRKENVSLF